MPSELINELIARHPEACALMVEILQSIDAEKRSNEQCDDNIRASFCLSSMTKLASDAIVLLSTSDITSTDSDHALGVMADFFIRLESAGISLRSIPCANDKPLGFHQAMSELSENADVSLFEVEVGLFNQSNDRAPFDTRTLHIAANDEDSVADLTLDYIEENIPSLSTVKIRVLDFVRANPERYSYPRQCL